MQEFHPGFDGVRDADFAERTISRSDAQRAITQEYGYESWARVKEVLAGNSQSQMHLNHNDRVPDGPFKQALNFSMPVMWSVCREHGVHWPRRRRVYFVRDWILTI